MLVSLWDYRRHILRNALNDLRHRYRGSLAGGLWNVFIPLAQIIVFSTIFSVLMEFRMPEMPGISSRFQFVVFLCSGLLAWNAFADTLMRGVASLVGNAGYLKKLPVPEQIFVAQDACSGLYSALIAYAVFLVFCVAVAGVRISWYWAQVIPLLILFIGFAFGLGLFLSCINVFFRDVQPLMNVMLLLWFWVTPIVYSETIFEGRSHEWVLLLLPLNPAYPFIRAFHEAVYLRTALPPGLWLTCTAFAAVSIGAAYCVLERLRSDIRDAL